MMDGDVVCEQGLRVPHAKRMKCACGCPRLIPKGANSNRKYATSSCKSRAKRAREKAQLLDMSPPDQRPKAASAGRDKSRGPKYDLFVESFGQALLDMKVTRQAVAEQMGVSMSTVHRYLSLYAHDVEVEEAHEEFVRDESLFADFGRFVREFWPDDDYYPYYDEWVELLGSTIDQGGRLMLLAPQRAATKTAFMIKWCVWRICNDFNIRLIWISQTAEMAGYALGAVREKLTDPHLVAACLGPKGYFQPQSRDGQPWTNERFTVMCRTKAMRSPTMVAVGKGGSLLSRDADGIVIDDMQEMKKLRSPTVREADQEWFFGDLLSRKEPHTGMAVIGTRQHVDDIYSHIIRQSDRLWTKRIYQIHDPACLIPDDEPEKHVDCVFNHARYPYWFILEQKEQNPAYFWRNMMNDPQEDTDVTYVTATQIAAKRDDSYLAGTVPVRGKLLCGIDPAASKPVAAVLWSWRDGKRYLVDAIFTGPGNRGAREAMQWMYDQYGCRRFVVEKNGYQKELLVDSEVKAMKAGLGLIIQPHYTGDQKWDEGTGVIKMLHTVANPDNGTIVLPAGGDALVHQRLADVYRQWVLFDPEYVQSRHAKDDLTMASWFPHLVMDGWDRHAVDREANVAYRPTKTVRSSYRYVGQKSPERDDRRRREMEMA